MYHIAEEQQLSKRRQGSLPRQSYNDEMNHLGRGLRFDFGFQYPNAEVKEQFVKESLEYEQLKKQNLVSIRVKRMKLRSAKKDFLIRKKESIDH